MFKEILIDIFKNFGLIYFLFAGVIFVVLGTPWIFARKRIHSFMLRRIFDSLLIALVFAPFVFAGDLATMTMPAICVIGIMILNRGGFTPVVFIGSLVSIAIIWLTIFSVWSIWSSLVKEK
jgi:hypothetical protein